MVHLLVSEIYRFQNAWRIDKKMIKIIFLNCIWTHKTCKRNVFVTHYMCKVFLYKFCLELFCSD